MHSYQLTKQDNEAGNKVGSCWAKPFFAIKGCLHAKCCIIACSCIENKFNTPIRKE